MNTVEEIPLFACVSVAPKGTTGIVIETRRTFIDPITSKPIDGDCVVAFPDDRTWHAAWTSIEHIGNWRRRNKRVLTLEEALTHGIQRVREKAMEVYNG